MPVSYIHFLLRSNCYAEALDFLDDNPDEARALNSARSTPIAVLIKSMTCGVVSEALYQSIPRYVAGIQDLFDTLLRLYPQGVANVDKRGDTALMIACRDGHIDCTGFGESNDKKILRWAIDCMIDACPAAVAISDGWGQLPLYHVWHLGGGPMDVITKLVRAYPDGLVGQQTFSINDMVDSDLHWDRIRPLLDICPRAAVAENRVAGLNPIQTLWFRIRFTYVDEVRVPSRSGPFNLTPGEISDIARRMMETGGQTTNSYYIKAKNLLLMLLKVAHRGTTAEDDDSQEFHPLHAAAGLSIPTAVLRLLSEMFPSELGQIDDDNNDNQGWCPLHIAAAGPYHSRGFDEINSPTSIEILIEKYPAAARMLDSKGKLPLHLALESGKVWDLGVEPLVRAAPMALRVASGQSRLYPFEIAARPIHEQEERLTLGTVFALLRADPSALDLARHRS